MISLLKPSILINTILFLLIAIVNIPVVAFHGAGHDNHLFVLSFFLSIFLIPQKLKNEDYKYVQYYYLGLLITYSFAGFWKFTSIAKDLVTNNPEVSWLEADAAKLNTFTNWHYTDILPPEFVFKLYDYPTLWIYVTFFGILFQTLSVLGAFNRKYLTFTMIFLVVFHLYTKFFVKADFNMAKYTIAILFFPYHYFYKFLGKISLKITPFFPRI